VISRQMAEQMYTAYEQ